MNVIDLAPLGLRPEWASSRHKDQLHEDKFNQKSHGPSNQQRKHQISQKLVHHCARLWMFCGYFFLRRGESVRRDHPHLPPYPPGSQT